MLYNQELNIAFTLVIINLITSAIFILKLSTSKERMVTRGGIFGLFTSLLIYSITNFILLITINKFIAEFVYYLSLMSLPFITGFLNYIAIVKIEKLKECKGRFEFISLILAGAASAVHLFSSSTNDLIYENDYTEATTNITSGFLIAYYSVMGSITLFLFLFLVMNSKGADRVQNKWFFILVIVCSSIEISKFFIFDETNYGENLCARFLGMTIMSSLILITDLTYHTSDVSELRNKSFYRSNIIPIFYYNKNNITYSNTGLKNLLDAWPGAPLLMCNFIEAIRNEFPNQKFPQEPATLSLRLKPPYPSNPKMIQATFTPLPNINEFACLIIDLSSEEEKWENHKEVINRLTHDIRSPLTVISGSIELLDEEIKNEAARSLINMVKSANDKIYNLLNEFFVIEDNDETTFEPEEFDPIEETIRISQSFISIFNSKKQAFSVNLKQSSIKILASKMDFYRIITNLLSNAHYHTRNNTKVEVSSTTKDDNIEIIVKDWARDNSRES